MPPNNYAVFISNNLATHYQLPPRIAHFLLPIHPTACCHLSPRIVFFVVKPPKARNQHPPGIAQFFLLRPLVFCTTSLQQFHMSSLQPSQILQTANSEPDCPSQSPSNLCEIFTNSAQSSHSSLKLALRSFASLSSLLVTYIQK